MSRSECAAWERILYLNKEDVNRKKLTILRVYNVSDIIHGSFINLHTERTFLTYQGCGK